MRRASLIFSVTLIVAIMVGYLARTAAAESRRDQDLRAAAELGAERIAGIVDALAVAAGSGSDPDLMVAALAEADPALGVCVVTSERSVCGGSVPQPTADKLTEHRELRRAGEHVPGQVTLTVYDAVLMIDVDGPGASIVADLPSDLDATRPGVHAYVNATAAAELVNGGFADDNGIRQTAAAVEGRSDLYVVASADHDVSLPGTELAFYVAILALAVVLLVLAGATMFTEQRNLVERASFDPLTRLPNRGEFERCAIDALDDAERQGAGVCLILFDLNGFKLINDTYGHSAGDDMLREIGSRLRKAVRDGDVVARWGGDEFVVLLPGIADAEMGALRAEQLAEQVSGRTRLAGVPDAVRVKVSAGVAIWPSDGSDLATLVEAADQAMYQAKRDGETWHVAGRPSKVPLPV